MRGKLLCQRNTTHYAREDIDRVAARVAQYLVDEGHYSFTRPVRYEVRYQTSEQAEYGEFHYEARNRRRLYLRLMRPSAYIETLSPVEQLVCKTSRVLLPRATEQIIQALLRGVIYGGYYSRYSRRGLVDPEWVQEVAKAHQIRILPRLEEEERDTKLTPEARNQRILGFYGPGGTLPGGMWYMRLDQAMDAYQKEYLRRLKWAEKAEKQGLAVLPYETWSEFLRSVADDWDEHQKRKKE